MIKHDVKNAGRSSDTAEVKEHSAEIRGNIDDIINLIDNLSNVKLEAKGHSYLQALNEISEKSMDLLDKFQDINFGESSFGKSMKRGDAVVRYDANQKGKELEDKIYEFANKVNFYSISTL